MSQKKVIAVMGATGAQGGGLVRATHADRQGPFVARPVTRKLDSEEAQALAQLGVEVVAGDADDPPSLDRAFAGASGAFCVTNLREHFSADGEGAQAAAMARATRKAGVQHVIWSRSRTRGRALGKERTFQRNDFLDVSKAIDIRVTIQELDAYQLGVFHEAADFGMPTTLTVGALVAWDLDAEDCEVTHGYPTKNWKKSKLVEREAVDVHWIPDSRDASRLLQFGMQPLSGRSCAG